jgi:ribonuclease HI
MSEKKRVDIFTDGACSGNPGPGGWGAILRYGSRERELFGAEANTTNNRMELTAAIMALEALKTPCDVVLYSDSRYLVDAVEKGWLSAWQARGWLRADKKPALNRDLWERLLLQMAVHSVRFVWVRGHNEHPENERCDRLATAQIKCAAACE